MPAITFYKHEPIPMEMHKVKIVQQLHLLPTAQVWRRSRPQASTPFSSTMATSFWIC